MRDQKDSHKKTGYFGKGWTKVQQILSATGNLHFAKDLMMKAHKAPRTQFKIKDSRKAFR
jgi:hypothetical protein